MVLLGAVAAGASGCGGDDVTIPASTVSDRVASELASMGLTPESISCGDALDAEVGNTTRCEIVVDGTTIGATVEVASVEGGEASLAVAVDEKPS